MTKQAVAVVHDGARYLTRWDDGTETAEDGQLNDAIRHAMLEGLRLDRIEMGGRVRFGLLGQI